MSSKKWNHASRDRPFEIDNDIRIFAVQWIKDYELYPQSSKCIHLYKSGLCRETHIQFCSLNHNISISSEEEEDDTRKSA